MWGEKGLRPRSDALIMGMSGKLLTLEILNMHREVVNHMIQLISHKAGSIWQFSLKKFSENSLAFPY